MWFPLWSLLMIWAIDDFSWFALNKSEIINLSSSCGRRDAHQFCLHLKSFPPPSFPQACPSMLIPSPNIPVHPPASPAVYGCWITGQQIHPARRKHMPRHRPVCVCLQRDSVFSGKNADTTRGAILQKTLLFCAIPRLNILLWRVEVLQIISHSHWNRIKYNLSHENKWM